MIRIDAIRELRRDLHMRPFEADRRVYLIFARASPERGRRRRAAEGSRGAAAVRGDRARRRRPRPDPRDDPLALPARAVLAGSRERRSASASTRARPSSPTTSARRSRGSPPGRLDRLERLLDPKSARATRAADRAGARRLPRPGVRARRRRRGGARERARARSTEARELEEARIAGLELTARDAEQQVKRAARGAEREELLAQIEELAAWYRDLVASRSAPRARRSTSTSSASCARTRRASGSSAPSAPPSTCASTWRVLEEFNLAPQLALEALFMKLAGELAA